MVVDHPADGVYEVAAGDVDWLFVPLEAAAKMRASFILLGPLLARFGRVIISNPGGDRIGRRPVNLHVDAMRAMGAEIDVPRRLLLRPGAGPAPRRRRSRFPQVTVMGTENAMLAATLADGHTVIRPAAQEPEVDDLIDFLQQDGRRREADEPGHDRGPRQAPAARREPHRRARTVSRPARSWSRPRSPAARSRSRTRRASTSRPWSSCWAGSASRSPAGSARSRSTPPDCGPATCGRATSRPRPIRASRPTSSRPRACC